MVGKPLWNLLNSLKNARCLFIMALSNQAMFAAQHFEGNFLQFNALIAQKCLEYLVIFCKVFYLVIGWETVLETVELTDFRA